MNFELRDFQKQAVNDLLVAMRRSRSGIADGDNPQTVVLSAPTASGKTVILASLIERILFGGGGLEDYDVPEVPRDPAAVFLWLSDSPQLNEQSLTKLMQASDMLPLTELVIVDQGFDAERFDGGKVYFLNSQKLGRGGLLSRVSNDRKYSIWETVANTQRELPNRFYVIVDEAHRGMRNSPQERLEAESIIQRFLVGHSGEYGIMPPANIVFGVSATPARFDAFLLNTNRITRSVKVPPSAARDAGLIKDYILLGYSEEQSSAEWTLLTEACEEYQSSYKQWDHYCQSNNLPPVRPILVIQIEDSPAASAATSKTNLDRLIEVVKKTLPEVPNIAFAHCLESGRPIKAGGIDIRYVDPSKVQSDDYCQVVIFKMALTTGWDCPRAEIMMSFRKAEDATLIAQLVGRIVRTPLAHRVAGNDDLNGVQLFLPKYDRKELASVVRHLVDDADVIGPDIGTKSEYQSLRVNNRKKEALDLYKTLPTYTSEEARKTTNVRVALRFADELATDGRDAEARDLKVALLKELLTIAREKDRDGRFSIAVGDMTEVKYRMVRVDNGEIQDDRLDEVKAATITPQDVDDLFRRSFTILTDELSKGYAAERYRERGAEADLSKCKLEAFVLSQDCVIFERMETAASDLFERGWDMHISMIQALSTERRAEYSRLLRVSKGHKLDVPTVPEPIRLNIEKDATSLEDHLLIDANGQFQAKLTSWESLVLSEESKRADFFCWLRNYPRKPWSIAVSYKNASGQDALSFPDFVVFRKTETGIVADLLEPHWGEDSLRKAKGLSEFVEKNPTSFGRVQCIRISNHGPAKRIDLRKKVVRERVMALADNDAFVALFDDPHYVT